MLWAILNITLILQTYKLNVESGENSGNKVPKDRKHNYLDI